MRLTLTASARAVSASATLALPLAARAVSASATLALPLAARPVSAETTQAAITTISAAGRGLDGGKGRDDG